MAEESIMRQELTTWLKKECQDAGSSMIYAVLGADTAQTEALRLTIANLHPEQARYIAGGVENLVRSAVSSMTNLPLTLLTADERRDIFEVKEEIEELLKAVTTKDVSGRPELMESLIGKLYGLNTVLRQILLEKVVECQCGKPGERYIPPTIKFPETEHEWYSLGEKMKSEQYHKYGKLDEDFESEVDDKVHTIKYNMPGSEDAKMWLVAKAGELDIKEY